MDLSPIMLSVKVAVISTGIVLVTATLLAWGMKKIAFWGKSALETLIVMPLVLPPTVIGFALLLLFGRQGPLGILLNNFFDIQIVFTWWAAVLAAAVVSFPLMYRSASAAYAAVDTKLEDAARTMGASELRIFCRISLPLALPGIIAGTLLAFARALGEFGATLMFAGNIPGLTQTIPSAIFFSVESGDMKTAGYLVLIISFISFVVTYITSKISSMEYTTYSCKGSECNVKNSNQKNFA